VSILVGFPEDVVSFDPDAQTASLQLDAELYPLGALYAAAYVFLDRAFLQLDAPDAKHFRVTLAWKKPPAGSDAGGVGALERLTGEFANELLSCAWRARIAEDSRAVIESATARALAGAMGAPSLDDLESFDFGDQPLEDPLGIALSWEEKYGKKKTEEPK
jgi:His-Xaa-Ser system protein HxsD